MNAPSTTARHRATGGLQPQLPAAGNASSHPVGQLLEVELTVTGSTLQPTPSITVTLSRGSAADLSINAVRVGMFDRRGLKEWLTIRDPAALSTGSAVWQHLLTTVAIDHCAQRYTLDSTSVEALLKLL